MATPVQITIDCTDPARLVAFWTYALGYVVEPPPDGHVSWFAYWKSIGTPDEELEGAEDASDSIIDPDGHGPRIWFQQVPEPKTVKNRVHLDLDVTGGRRSSPLPQRHSTVDARVAELVEQGGRIERVLSPAGADYYAVVMADPEGNEFCVA